MSLSDELTALLARTGVGILDDANSFGAALDDFLPHEVASRGVINLLVDAVRQGSIDRLLRDIAHGADPARAVETWGDQLARDRASTESASSRWAVAVLGYAAGVVDRQVLDEYRVPTATRPGDGASHGAPVALESPAPAPGAHATVVSSPPAGPPPGWPPPPAPAPPGRRTGRAVAAAGLLVLAVVGAAITAVVLSDSDEDPSTPKASQSETTSSPTAASSAVPLDPRKVEEALRAASRLIVIHPNSTRITARSWSTEKGNLDADGRPRPLTGAERAQATEWSIEDDDAAVSVTHVPADAPDGVYMSAECTADLKSCEAFTIGDGRRGIEGWSLRQEGWLHLVVIEAGAESPQITVSESLSQRELSLSQIRKEAVLSSQHMRSAAADPRLLIPLPSPPPGLPSVQACLVPTPPDDCPEGIS